MFPLLCFDLTFVILLTLTLPETLHVNVLDNMFLQ